jgi:hypothetical protein
MLRGPTIVNTRLHSKSSTVTNAPTVQPVATMAESFHDTAQPPYPARAAQDRAVTHRTGEKAAHFREAGTDCLRAVCDRHGTPTSLFLDIATPKKLRSIATEWRRVILAVSGMGCKANNHGAARKDAGSEERSVCPFRLFANGNVLGAEPQTNPPVFPFGIFRQLDS